MSPHLPSVGCPNPACAAIFVVKAEQVGRKAKCPKCGTPFLLNVETIPPPLEKTPPTIAATAKDEPGVPARIGRYEVHRLLGKGGMGSVFLARDPELDRLVALKVPNPGLAEDPVFLERFRREAKSAAAFRHPNFCPVYEVGQDGGTHYLAMAYIEGQTLADRIKAVPAIRPREAAAIVRDLARALAEAHRRNIIHRDLKPQNIMLDHRGQLVIMDFGLARRAGRDDEPTLTGTNAAMGTPAYMSPEQVRGDKSVGPATDLYALGVILYELLTEKRPFSGVTSQIFVKIATEMPVSPSKLRDGIEPELEAICMRAMAKDPKDRQPSAEVLAEELAHWIDVVDHGETATAPSFRDSSTHTRSRRSMLIGGAAVLGTATLGGVAFALRQSGQGNDSTPDTSSTNSGGAVPYQGKWALEIGNGAYARTDLEYDWDSALVIEVCLAPTGNVVRSIFSSMRIARGPGAPQGKVSAPPWAGGLALGGSRDGHFVFHAQRAGEASTTVSTNSLVPGRYHYVRGVYAPAPHQLILEVDGAHPEPEPVDFEPLKTRPFLIGAHYGPDGEPQAAFHGRVAWIRVSDARLAGSSARDPGPGDVPERNEHTKLLLDFTKGPDDAEISRAISQGHLTLQGAKFVHDETN
jgi:serine/threonine protein kinase